VLRKWRDEEESQGVEAIELSRFFPINHGGVWSFPFSISDSMAHLRIANQ
jgi:hypothetical protein